MPGTAVTRRRVDSGVKRTARTRLGLALAGGGPLGGIYEVGALIALADSLEGIDFNDLDVYVGVSSGGFVAAALANGISPAQMYRLFIDDGADAGLSPGLFLRPAFGEFARRAASLPRLLLRSSFDFLRHPLQRSLLESMATLGRAVPTGLFDQHAIDAFLTRLLQGPGRTQRFPEAVTQAVSGGHQSRYRRLGDVRHTGARPCADHARPSRLRPRCPAFSRRWKSTASTTSTVLSTRRCTLRSPSTRVSRCSSASTRWCPSTRARLRVTAGSRSKNSTMADCRWSSRRRFARSFIRG